ncbi:XRE family transcriptional regulator [Lactiplantibacillus plantarum EGD-AQ4]|nr:type II toxin-antitoxin system MqsA family antitoxin [Lactiplantibacillus pentosus]EIW12429.1 transcriptional regulator [Lactiplantibacillus pentosus KCA1]EQM52901.1 XRE family transcriptional regulator [Lactiplantibacillus plantarum EGD-AQ4]
MSEKLTDLQKSIQQATAALNGDYSNITVHESSLQLVPHYSAQDIKAIRSELGITQRVLALVLAVSPRTVEAWEAGKSQPNGSACRLLQLIQQYPNLIKEIFTTK